MARTVRIADVTPRAGKWPNLIDATIPGVPYAQVARVVATCGDREERIAIVFSTQGVSLDPTSVESAVRAHLAGFHLGIVESNPAGVVKLRIADSIRGELVFIASAAAAVLQCSWGWDESPSITVTAGDQSFQFEVTYEGDGTHTAIEQTIA